MAQPERSQLQLMLPVARIARVLLVLALAGIASLLIDPRLEATLAALAVTAVALRGLRRRALAGLDTAADEVPYSRIVSRVSDLLATGWLASGVLFILGLPIAGAVVLALVAIAYVALSSLGAQLVLSGLAGLVAGHDGAVASLRFFDHLREAWLPRPRLVACSLAGIIGGIETAVAAVLLATLVDAGPFAALASALLLRSFVTGAAWVYASRPARPRAEVIELPRAAAEAIDRDIAA